MWLIAMLGMATSFAESTLAQLYKNRDADGNYRGGPAYYMEKGLGMRWMGVLFSIFLIIAFGLVFNAVQANSIVGAMQTAFGVEAKFVGIALVVISVFIIFGGLQEAAAGGLGYAIAQAMIQGIKRGLFSNEAGMGSAPNAAASATPYPPHPAFRGTCKCWVYLPIPSLSVLRP
jgi:AGCS family alanine or glycine:cation symporter